MTILNYFFIGTGFTFLIDLLLGLKGIKNHPLVKSKIWGLKERILCIIIWPIAVLIFLMSFIKSYFKK